MAKTVAFHNPAFEDGVEFDVSGLLIPNGGSVELTEEQELFFFSRNQATVDDYFKNSEQIKVSGSTELSSTMKEAHTGVGISDQPATNIDAEVAPLAVVESLGENAPDEVVEAAEEITEGGDD